MFLRRLAAASVCLHDVRMPNPTAAAPRTDPLQRLRHELRRPPVARAVAAPATTSRGDYKDLGYWTDLAQLLERGRFDGLFIADVLGTYDVYGGSDEAAIRHGAQVPVNDPLLLVSAMAAVTEHLGFGITAGTAYEHPYPFARRMSTLDHLTKGRVGWNVVTGYLPERRAQHGRTTTSSTHDDRYDHADEYLEVLYKLWEGSWEDDAVVRDRETRRLHRPGEGAPDRPPRASTSRCPASTSPSRRRSARR